MITTDNNNEDEVQATIIPIFRKYNPLTDLESITIFLKENQVAPPFDHIVFGVIASINDKIVGFATLLVNHFIEPLVVDQKLSVLTKMKIWNGLMLMLGGVALYLGIEKLYFTIKGDNEHYIQFLQRQFKVKEFTTQKVYSVEV